jgi:hypothetical protein
MVRSNKFWGLGRHSRLRRLSRAAIANTPAISVPLDSTGGPAGLSMSLDDLGPAGLHHPGVQFEATPEGSP